MANNDSAGVHINTQGTAYVPEVRSCMITLDRLTHLDSLAKRAEENERPSWDFMEILGSAGASIALLALAEMVSIFVDGAMQISPWLWVVLWVCTISGLGISGVCFKSKIDKNKNQRSCLTELRSILKKQAKLYESQGSKTQTQSEEVHQ